MVLVFACRGGAFTRTHSRPRALAPPAWCGGGCARAACRLAALADSRTRSRGSRRIKIFSVEFSPTPENHSCFTASTACRLTNAWVGLVNPAQVRVWLRETVSFNCATAGGKSARGVGKRPHWRGFPRDMCHLTIGACRNTTSPTSLRGATTNLLYLSLLYSTFYLNIRRREETKWDVGLQQLAPASDEPPAKRGEVACLHPAQVA